MKTYYFLIALFFMLFSCSKKENLPKEDESGRKIFYDWRDYYDYSQNNKNNKSVIIIDTACINSREKALNDIKNNKLTYYTGLTPHEKELSKALKIHGVNLKCNAVYKTCYAGRFGVQCYEYEMNNELNNRFGKDYLDSIWDSTLEEHVRKFPNETLNEDGKLLKLKDCYQFLKKTAHNSGFAQ